MSNKKQYYKYTDQDLLNNPQKYQMSEFNGTKFLSEYQNVRKEILGIIRKKHSLLSIEKAIKVSKNNTNKIETEDFLKNYIITTPNLELENKINGLIKKFEITKKIFTKYDNELNKNSERYDNISNYILLSIICLKLYKKNKNLKFLNTTLKLNDIVISQFNKISKISDFSLIDYCLSEELDEIGKLEKSMGVI
jgi:hypothetical protein